MTFVPEKKPSGAKPFERSEPPPTLVRPTREQAEADLTFVGFVGLADPPRPEVRGAIAACQKAGIRIVQCR